MMNLPWDHTQVDVSADASLDFPQRAWCFDPRWLFRALASVGVGPLTGEPSIANVWHLPGQALTVVYDLGRDQRITVVFARGGVLPAESGVARDAASRGAPGLRLPDDGAVAWFWPHDPLGLPLRAWLEQLATVGPSVDARCEPRVLSYLPGQRCVWRCEGGGPGEAIVFKGSMDRADRHRVLRALWRHPERRFGMAEPLGGDASSGLRWERFVVGERLEAVAARDGWAAALTAVAPALAGLHRLETVPCEGRLAAGSTLARLERKVMRRIEAALPAWVSPCRALIARLAASQPIDEPGDATVHGDLHTGNLLIDASGQVTFIDLDDLAQGPPAHDLALLLSRLMLVCLVEGAALPRRRSGGLVEVQRAIDPFVDAYVAAGGDPAVRATLDWHLAALLLGRQLRTCIRHHAPNMDLLASGVVDLAAYHLVRAEMMLGSSERSGSFSEVLTQFGRTSGVRQAASGTARKQRPQS